MIVIGIVAGLCAAVAVAQNQQPTPYQNWVDQDVLYLISVEERSAFMKLTTDDERNQFIEQFWLRRDPTPDTEANEMKIEHYRRIRYATERFKDIEPGWMTDRGRTYIIYGPPDEIESFISKENWRYRHLDGVGDYAVFQFVKRPNGEFRLVSGPVGTRKPALPRQPQRRDQ